MTSHTFLPPGPDATLRVWTVTREELDSGRTTDLSRWPCYTPEEALICACRHEIGKPDGAVVYHVVAHD